MDQYDIRVEFTDGMVRDYKKVQTTQKDGCLLVWVAAPDHRSVVLRWVLPLVNIREVSYP